MNYILSEIERNNEMLSSMRSTTEVNKLSAKINNNLYNPSVSYEHKGGNNFSVSQSFDFPTLYFYRNQLSKLSDKQAVSAYFAFKRELLLQVKLLCLNLIYLNQQDVMLKLRLLNAQILSDMYKERVSKGQASVLEKNKIDLERMNVLTNIESNKAALRNAREQLKAFNGGIPLSMDLLAYTDTVDIPSHHTLKTCFVQSDEELNMQKWDVAIAKKKITIAKAGSLPKLELQYKQDLFESHIGGISVGMSIPIFANTNKIRLAEESFHASMKKAQSKEQNTDSQFEQLYNDYLRLKESLKNYKDLFKLQNNLDVINKSVKNNEITMLQYFVELNSYYDSYQILLDLENQYQVTIAKLMKFKL
ncbi:MAG: TolC family protein [Bacteroidales bacterium]